MWEYQTAARSSFDDTGRACQAISGDAPRFRPGLKHGSDASARVGVICSPTIHRQSPAQRFPFDNAFRIVLEDILAIGSSLRMPHRLPHRHAGTGVVWHGCVGDLMQEPQRLVGLLPVRPVDVRPSGYLAKSREIPTQFAQPLMLCQGQVSATVKADRGESDDIGIGVGDLGRVLQSS
jgi:hypothetical protein